MWRFDVVVSAAILCLLAVQGQQYSAVGHRQQRQPSSVTTGVAISRLSLLLTDTATPLSIPVVPVRDPALVDSPCGLRETSNRAKGTRRESAGNGDVPQPDDDVASVGSNHRGGSDLDGAPSWRPEAHISANDDNGRGLSFDARDVLASDLGNYDDVWVEGGSDDESAVSFHPFGDTPHPGHFGDSSAPSPSSGRPLKSLGRGEPQARAENALLYNHHLLVEGGHHTEDRHSPVLLQYPAVLLTSMRPTVTSSLLVTVNFGPQLGLRRVSEVRQAVVYLALVGDDDDNKHARYFPLRLRVVDRGDGAMDGCSGDSSDAEDDVDMNSFVTIEGSASVGFGVDRQATEYFTANGTYAVRVIATVAPRRGSNPTRRSSVAIPGVDGVKIVDWYFADIDVSTALPLRSFESNRYYTFEPTDGTVLRADAIRVMSTLREISNSLRHTATVDMASLATSVVVLLLSVRRLYVVFGKVSVKLRSSRQTEPSCRKKKGGRTGGA